MGHFRTQNKNALFRWQNIGCISRKRMWHIPIDAVKPVDGRYKSQESILSQIDRKKPSLTNADL